MNEAAVSKKLRESFVSSDAICWKISDRFYASRPDLFVAYKGKTAFIEVKVHPNEVSSLQCMTLLELSNQGIPAYTATYYPKVKDLQIFIWGVGTHSKCMTVKETTLWLLEQLS